MRQFFTEKRGAMTIVEATFVFPIMFFIVFFMIMAGEAYYQRAVVEYTVNAAAVNGAAQCENPMLGYILDHGSVPTSPTAADVMPYRYIFTGEAQRIGSIVAAEVTGKLNAMEPLLFRNMSPTNVSVTAKPQVNILVSSLPVECSFDIPFPIRFIFSGDVMKMHYSFQTTASIGDPAEFVRNVALVGDIIQRSEAATEVANKALETMQRIGVYVN